MIQDSSHDSIRFQNLAIACQIGVPDQERACWQTLYLDATLYLAKRFEDMQDQLQHTVDYAEQTNKVRALATAKPRHLIETLAADIASLLLAEPTVQAVELELKKHILPGVDHVSVRMFRHRAAS